MGSMDGWLRRVVPSVPALSRVGWLMLPLDAADWALRWPWRELRELPPNRMRIRVGVGNRILFNAAYYRLMPMNFWLTSIAEGVVGLRSVIVDLGCGCGRFAMPLREIDFHGRRFEGRYIGIDVDREMLAWCRAHFPPERFRFEHVDAGSLTYNPRGAEPAASVRLAVDDASADLVLANSLFTHLLEQDFAGYVREAGRVLRRGGHLQFSAFVLEDMDTTGGGAAESRWTFKHEIGAARVESLRYPEAAVAYRREWIDGVCRSAGFELAESLPRHAHSMLRWRRV